MRRNQGFGRPLSGREAADLICANRQVPTARPRQKGRLGRRVFRAKIFQIFTVDLIHQSFRGDKEEQSYEKRTLALLLALAMLLTFALSGCGGNETSSTASGGDTSTQHSR